MKVLRKSFFVFLLLMLSLSLFAQTKIDSLESQLTTVENIEKVNILNKLATAYLNKSPQKAIEYSNQSLKLSKEINYIEGEAHALKTIGVGNYYLSNFDKSLEYYFKSLKIMEDIDDKEGISTLFNNIGVIYWRLGNFDQALEIYSESLKIVKELGNKEGISKPLNNIGLIYMTLGNYEKALEKFLASLEIVKEIENKNIIAYCVNNIGIIYWYLENYEKSLEYYLESLIINKELNNKYGIAGSLKNIGGVYLQLNNYDKALTYLDQSLKLAKEIEAKDLIQNIYASYYELFLKKEYYQKSLEYFKLYTAVKDSMFTEESSKKIAEMQTKYETEKKEKENEILKKDNDIQKLEINKQQNLRNSFIAISILILFLVFVIYARYRSKQKMNILLNQKNNVIESANTELNKKNKQITKQKNQLSKTLKELRETQKMLTDTAHRAGMAEIATGILHNIGNILNSVKVSSQILKEKVKSSKVNNLQKVLTLMEEHTDDLGKFITSNEKGKMLPPYLLKVGTALKTEQDNSLEELSTLHKGINHIEEIIAVQQSYAGVSGLIEKVKLSKMMDDVLKMHSEIFRKYKIKIIKKYSKTKPILIEKGKFIQVLVNLLKNAKESLETKDEKNRIISINISEDDQHQIIEIIDNGPGISKENLTKIFSYGFSTKKNGKGFGLHTSALAMTEMKGKLLAKSKGKGAKFVMFVPIEQDRSKHEDNIR